MNAKHKIIICVVSAIIISTGYFLYQIDLHEKALLSKEWLNPVPTSIYQTFTQNQPEYGMRQEKQIQQNIQSMYRSLAAIDGILVLSVILFIVFYKDKGVDTVTKG